ncbi:MAG TPA: glycosyltransferase [Desulfomonilaceae bacterium]|nr:glycosyltransferase [Desulfomonilaceae bacterium]
MWVDLAAWAGVIFLVGVLIELIRLDFVFLRAFLTEPKMAGPISQNPGEDLPLISVVVPAKDEERHLERSARAVLASDYKRLELILINDRSRDNTLEIMDRLGREDARVKVISIENLPSGWTGKTHAMFQGAARSSGEILLFTDADTALRPDALSRSLNFFVKERLDMLSLFPAFARRGFVEDAVYTHLALGISFFYPLTEVNDLAKPGGLASGCFIMLRKTVYDEIGTWRRLKNEVTEDVALSKAVKAQGRRLMVLRGAGVLSTKPFDSVSDVCRFWKRTYYGGLERSVTRILRLATNYTALTVTALLFIFSGIVWLNGAATLGMTVLFFLAALATAGVVIPFCFFIDQEEGNWLYGLTAPVGIAISAWVAFTTLVAVLSDQGIRWRGSTYK